MTGLQLPLFQRKTYKGIIPSIGLDVRVPAGEMTVLQTLPAYYTYLKDGGFSQYTPDDFTGDLKKFGVFLKEKQIKDIADKDILSWISFLKTPNPKGDGLSRKTVSRKLSALGNYFFWLISSDVIAEKDNPMLNIANIRISSPLPEILFEEECRRLLATASSDPRIYLLFLLFLETGIKLEELFALRVSHVDVLTFVNQKTGCLSPFTHLLSRYGKQEPQTPILIGSVLAFAENIGIYRMAEISDISLQDLLTASRDFIRLETLRPANDLVTNAMARLPIFKFYNIDGEIIHGSVDGQKLDTQIETINARNSPKYFGLGKGVSAITLVANHIAPNAKIIGAHEHESYFAYDLIYNNTSDVDPRILSSDDHGINQVNHMVLDVFGHQFSPRYVSLNSDTLNLYGFHDPSFYKDCIVKPSRKVKKQLIIQEWPENILRILVSLGLKTTTQSTIIRKLSSHLRKNRTKKAMWEFDNIIKSIDKLRYIDSLIFRQHIQKALNRGEAYHKLKRAVFHDNQGKFRVRTELEQNIWSECARFVTNNIIFCNAYILSALYEAAIKAGKYEEAEAIKRISPVAWRHINLRGRFEFQKQIGIVDIDQIIKVAQQKDGLLRSALDHEAQDNDAYFTFLRG